MSKTKTTGMGREKTSDPVIWHGLPRSTWLWSAYNIVFTTVCSWSGHMAMAAFGATMTVVQIIIGGRLAYWTEQAQLARQREASLRQQNEERDE